jgi:hypothetical protein
MSRLFFGVAALSAALLPSSARAQVFDRYLNPILAKAPGADGVKEIKQLTPSLISNNDHVLPDTQGAMIVVKTNESRFSKLMVQAARQKVGDKSMPILIIERFVTFREGTDRAVQAKGENVHLFEGFHFSLDMGQVVPPALGGDLRLVVDGRKVYAEPLNKARLFLVTKPLPGTEPKKAATVAVGETFEARYFNGTYKLYDDGRRSGTLTLKVAEDGDVSGDYFSDKDGQKYEVFGKIGTSKHVIQFTIKFPQTRQVFQGWLFTGNAKALTGSSRLQDREAGFYAIRQENE